MTALTLSLLATEPSCRPAALMRHASSPSCRRAAHERCARVAAPGPGAVSLGLVQVHSKLIRSSANVVASGPVRDCFGEVRDQASCSPSTSSLHVYQLVRVLERDKPQHRGSRSKSSKCPAGSALTAAGFRNSHASGTVRTTISSFPSCSASSGTKISVSQNAIGAFVQV